ncbi:MAG: GntR family transcriptional regulator [Micrococcales bacterium]|nr:GntR family transcriptional regulator [Micrococcales bacterium]
MVPLLPAIDPTGDRPAYRQLADALRAAIESGEIGPGEQLPSERSLMEQSGTARGTVRQAIAQLRVEGLIEIEHGRGAFVRRRPVVRRVAHDRFARRHREEGQAAYLAEMAAEGRAPEVEVLEVAPHDAPDDVADRLELGTNRKVLVRSRRYLADGQPMELATSYIPWDLAKGTQMTKANTGPGGIYARLEENGHRLARFAEEVAARMPSPEEARALRLVAGVPVMTVVRTAFDTKGRAVEVCDTVMASDRYVLSYELPAR